MGVTRAVQNAYFNNYIIDGDKPRSFEEFKRWLKRFDTNKDGKLSVEELEHAIRTTGSWFPKRKAKNAISLYGKKEKGYIHEDEIINLVDFARNQLGLNIAN